MAKSKRLLVIGGTGFLGKHILIRGLSLGFKLTSISFNKPSKKFEGVKYIQMDIRKKKNFLKLDKNFEYIINVGGYGGYKVNEMFSKKDSQYLGLKNLAGYFLKKKIKKFIQIGTSLEYGNNKNPHSESMLPRNPLSNYGKSKLYATNYLVFLNKFFNFPSVIIRLYQVYGPHQESNRLIGYVLNSIKKNKTINISGGSQKRDFLYVKDFVDAIFLILKSNKTTGEIINLGYGKTYKIKDVVKKILLFFPNKRFKVKIKSLNKKDPIELLPNISKLKRLINWEPKISLASGIKKIKDI